MRDYYQPVFQGMGLDSFRKVMPRIKPGEIVYIEFKGEYTFNTAGVSPRLQKGKENLRPEQVITSNLAWRLNR